MFSLTRFWPMYSSRRFGRTLTSSRASSSNACPDTIRSGCLCCIIRFAVPSVIFLYGLGPVRVLWAKSFSLWSRCFSFWRAQGLQRATQQLFKISGARLALRFSDRGLRGAAIVPKVDQRRDDIGLDSRGRRRGRSLGLDRHRFQLVF